MQQVMGNYRENVKDDGITIRYINSGDNLMQTRNATYTILDIEIDRGCADFGCSPRNSNSLCDSSDPQIPLYQYHEIPHFLQGNPFVKEGYRAFLSAGLCFRSLFVWSNETVNIWSHLLGFIFFTFMMLYDNIIVIPDYGGTLADHFIITLGLMCYQFCMLCSAGYHLFYCHSEKASRRWLAVDLSGIAIGLIGCYLPAVHWAFYCLSVWRDVYLMVITMLSFTVLFFQFHSEYFSPRWARHRMMLYLGLAAYGIIPSVHWVILNGGFEAKVVQMFIPKVIVMYLIGCCAFTFYITQFPEKCFPGKVDYIGSSHQWWHIIVVLALYYWHNAGQELLRYRLQETCHA